MECRYGTACYNRNPDHRKAYTHPCRWGAKCRDLGDLAHGVLFTHPAPTTNGSDSSDPWVCAACTLANDVHDQICAVCGTPAPAAASHTTAAMLKPPEPVTWRCAECTFENTDATSRSCEVCAEPRPRDFSPTPGQVNAARTPTKRARPTTDTTDTGDLDPRGMNIVFTGTFEGGNRATIESAAENLGAKVQSTVTKATQLLVIGGANESIGSTKERKAAELGIKVLRESAWQKAIAHLLDGARAGKRRKTVVAAENDDIASGLNGEGSENENMDCDDDGGGGGAGAGPPAVAPKNAMAEGEVVEIKSSSSSSVWRIKRTADHYYCNCPAWRNQSAPVDGRSCKHLREYLGDEFEQARIGHILAGPVNPRAAAGAPKLLLAHSWEENVDPTGYHISEKLDGVRAFWDGTSLLSRNGNVFPAPDWFLAPLKLLPRGTTLDGELFSGRGKFNDTTSIVKTTGSPRWRSVIYKIFDVPSEVGGMGQHPFEDRCKKLESFWQAPPSHLEIVTQIRCTGIPHVYDELKRVQELGGEGLMLRQPKSVYAHGRSNSLLKVKSFYDAEAEVTGHDPGKGKHTGKCGALVCKMASGKVFRAGTGLSDKDRARPPPVGAIINYRFFELTPDGVPRFPVFVGVCADKDCAKDAVMRKVTSAAK